MKSGQRVVKKLLNTKYNVSEMWNEAGKNPITGGFREKFDNLKMILVERIFFIVIYFYRTRVRSLFTLVTHSLTHSLTDSLTHCCLVNLIDVTLACEDSNSKLVEVVTVADVSDEDRVGIWQQFVADLEAKVWSTS